MDIYLFSGTHWDREWYQTFQGFRMRLVKMMDELIEILETRDDYGVFHFDGQTIVLEDYLEIRPEKKDQLKKLVQEGKMEIGPWFTLPDCAPIQGESVVRNIQYGVKRCKEFGEPLKCPKSLAGLERRAILTAAPSSPRFFSHCERFGDDAVNSRASV